MAVPSFIDSQTQDEASALDMTFDMSTITHAADDLMIVCVKQCENTSERLWDDDGGGGNGWTLNQQHRTTGGRDQETAVYWKIATSGSESDPTFTWATGITAEPMSGSLLVYRGVDLITPFSEISWRWAQNDASPPNPDVTISYENTRVVCFHASTHDDITTVAAPTGFTLRTQVWNGTANDHRNHFTADIERDTLGTYSPPDWQHSSSNNTPEYHTYTIAINEAQPIHVTGGTATESFFWGDTNLTVTGDGFEAVQGTGKVEYWDDELGTTKTTQTIDSWSDTSIQLDTTQGSLPNDQTIYLVVTNDSGDVSLKVLVLVGIPPYEDWINATLKPDHRWLFDGTDEDDGITGPQRDFDTSVVGTPTYPTTILAGNNTNSLYLDGVTEAMESLQSPNMNITISSKERTVMMWIKLDSIQKSLSVLWKEGGGVQNLCFPIGVGNVLMWQLADSAGSRDNVQAYSDFRLIPDRIYCILGRYSHLDSPKESRLYIDGVKQTVTDGNPMTLGIFDSHSGSNCIGNPDNNLEMGTVDINFAGQEGCTYSHFCTWSDNSTNDSAGGLTDEEISLLFERGAIPTITIDSDTEVNMQADLDSYADTVRSNTPLAIRIEKVTGGGDLELVADNITFDDACSLNIQWMGVSGETLTWVNSNGGSIDSEKTSAFIGGDISIEEDVPVKITVKDIDTLVVISGATVILEADSGGDLSVGTDIIKELSSVSGITETNLRYTSDQPVIGIVREAPNTGQNYKQSPISSTITSTGLDITIFLIKD